MLSAGFYWRVQLPVKNLLRVVCNITDVTPDSVVSITSHQPMSTDVFNKNHSLCVLLDVFFHMQSCQNMSLNQVSKGFCTFDVEFCSINSEGVSTTWSWGSDGLQFSKQSSQELYEPCQCSSSKVRNNTAAATPTLSLEMNWYFLLLKKSCALIDRQCQRASNSHIWS